ncbi:hypothetical protein J6590_054740 [Homalodisca vitripennis]|nr:hypothetical protein J6590_054740 [Homalodisca vitripennis]
MLLSILTSYERIRLAGGNLAAIARQPRDAPRRENRACGTQQFAPINWPRTQTQGNITVMSSAIKTQYSSEMWPAAQVDLK